MVSRMLALVLLLVPLLGCSGEHADPVPVAATARTPAADPLAVLHAWDASRAQAWERGDPVGLAALYVAGSGVGAEDVALLQRYRARGVRLSGMRMQVLAARVVVRGTGRLRVVVVERFAGATATRGTATWSLPAGVPVRRVVELRRPAGRWQVAVVRPLLREGSR